MVCNRSGWLQNRAFSGTILPIATIRAAKENMQKHHQPWGISLCIARLTFNSLAIYMQSVVADRI